MFDNFVLDEMPMQEDFLHPEGKHEFDIVGVKTRNAGYNYGPETVIDIRMKSDKGYFTETIRSQSPDLTARRISIEKFGDYMFACGVKEIDLKGKTEDEADQILSDTFMMKRVIVMIFHKKTDGRIFVNSRGIFNLEGITRKQASRGK